MTSTSLTHCKTYLISCQPDLWSSTEFQVPLILKIVSTNQTGNCRARERGNPDAAFLCFHILLSHSNHLQARGSALSPPRMALIP